MRARDASASADRLAREIEHHRRIAETAEAIWDWDSPAGRRRAERRARLYVEQAALAPGRRALELGCGTGLFLERTARSGATIEAIDLSMDLLARARERVRGCGNVRLLNGNAEHLPFPDATFDAVYGSSILHHLHLERALAEVYRVLKPQGRIVFTEPNLLNPHVAFLFLLAPRERFGVSPDEMAFTRFNVKRVLVRIGFSDVHVRNFDFLHPAVPQGFVSAVARLGGVLEALPGAREISGSLLVCAARA